MAKEKKRNYENNSKSEILSDDTRNALLGILVFLMAVIGLVETAGPLGKIIRYIFVYLLGTFSSLVLLALSILGIFVFIKRKFPKIKINITLGAVIALVLFSLIYSSQNDWTINNLAANYRDIFDSISQEGYITILTSSIKGGLIGHLLYTLLSSVLGSVGVQIVCVVFIIGSLIVILQPAIYFLGNKLMMVTSKVEQDYKKRKKDKEVIPGFIYSMDNEDIKGMKKDGFKFVDDEIKNVELEEAKEKPKKRTLNLKNESSFVNTSFLLKL